MPGHIHRKGRIGVVSRSGTLTYEAVAMLTEVGLGQSTALWALVATPSTASKHIDVMKDVQRRSRHRCRDHDRRNRHPDEAEAAQWCKANMKKPVVGFIAGVTAPPGKRMGHAGALISGGADTADAKLAIMEESGFVITRNPSELGKLLKAQAEVIQRFQASPWVGLPRTVDCTATVWSRVLFAVQADRDARTSLRDRCDKFVATRVEATRRHRQSVGRPGKAGGEHLSAVWRTGLILLFTSTHRIERGLQWPENYRSAGQNQGGGQDGSAPPRPWL